MGGIGLALRCRTVHDGHGQKQGGVLVNVNSRFLYSLEQVTRNPVSHEIYGGPPAQ
jgi:hypothetical protein